MLERKRSFFLCEVISLPCPVCLVSLIPKPCCKYSSFSAHCFSLENFCFCFCPLLLQLLNSVSVTANLPLRARQGRNVSRQSQSSCSRGGRRGRLGVLNVLFVIVYSVSGKFVHRIGLQQHIRRMEGKGPWGSGFAKWKNMAVCR